jgi:DNA-binding NtrC family response regulator
MKKKSLVISPEAMEHLQAYRWPGNVRELQNCIERAVILAEGDTLLPRHLNLSFAAPLESEIPVSPWEQIDLSGTLPEALRRITREAEKFKIQLILQEAQGNKGRAAELLQISYKMLLAKIKEYGIE